MRLRPAVALGVVVFLGTACGDDPGAGRLPDAPVAPSDRDGDGVPDATDNCPDLANADQLDVDHDGIGDACGPSDRDGDGVPDATDNCPDLANADQLDTDHDGMGDVCDPEGTDCPALGTLPEAQPYNDYVIDGTTFFTDEVQRWTWTVEGGPCDQLFASEAKPVSFSLTGADTSQLTFRPTATGDYNIRVTAMTVAGKTPSCTFPVHVAGIGMRVELCWDDTGNSSLDLHLHAPHTTTPWFPINLSDACSFANCSAYGNPHINWGYVDSTLEQCENGPDGADWRERGGCSNPRLDFDNLGEVGVPENINIDLPEDGATYRAMAAYSTGLGPRSPIANVYCQGRLVASLGRAPDMVAGFDTPGAGSTWRVADITTHVDANGLTTCNVAMLHPAGQTTGYDVRKNNVNY